MGGESITNAEDPFNIDVKDFRSKAPASDCRSCLFARQKDGQDSTCPSRRQGPLGPIWGYVALEYMETIYGAVFDHKTETPGLGAGIKEGFFQAPFKGKINKVAPTAVVKAVRRPPSTAWTASPGARSPQGVGEMVDRPWASTSSISNPLQHRSDEHRNDHRSREEGVAVLEEEPQAPD